MLSTIKKLFAKPLTIKVQDYNLVVQDPEYIRVLRLLTLGGTSGMNHELDSFARIRLERDVDCKIFTAYRGNELVGWAFISGEPSTFVFTRSFDGFNPEDGLMFQVYVSPDHRRQGIARELLKVANNHSNGKKLCVCPWDETSELFYGKLNETFQAKYL